MLQPKFLVIDFFSRTLCRDLITEKFLNDAIFRVYENLQTQYNFEFDTWLEMWTPNIDIEWLFLCSEYQYILPSIEIIEGIDFI